MSGVPNIEIYESVEVLQKLMKQQETGLGFAKIQTLYLLKIKAAETVRYLAILVGRSETTVYRWLQAYRQGGITLLLEDKNPPGRPPKVDVETAAKLQQELRDPEGFSSYIELKFWLNLLTGNNYKYSTLYRVVHYELQAKLKVPRPQSDRQSQTAINSFKEKLTECLLEVKSTILESAKTWERICYWCSDETRLGLQAISGRKLTLRGVKPRGIRQWSYKYFYLYGLVEPKTGRSFFYEFSHLDTVCFERFLKQFSESYSREIHIIQVDNAPSHTSEQLEVPENIYLLFQPSYSPQVNPIERLWGYLKSFLKWGLFESLDELREKVRCIVNSFSQEIIHSLTGWDFILRSLSLAGL